MNAVKKNEVLKFILLIVLLVFAIYIFRFSQYSNKISLINVKNFVESFGVLSSIVFIAVYVFSTLVSIPGVILTFIGAILFGTLLGTILNLMGATLGAGLAFHISKFLGRGFVESLLKKNYKKFDKFICKNGFNGILILRLMPLFPFVGINYGAGLCKINFKDYITATFIGMIPGTFVYTYLFATIGERALMGAFSWKELLNFNVMLPIILFVVLTLIPVIYKKMKVKNEIL